MGELSKVRDTDAEFRCLRPQQSMDLMIQILILRPLPESIIAQVQLAYLDLAADLKPLLAEIDGFISIERFQSLADPQRLLLSSDIALGYLGDAAAEIARIQHFTGLTQATAIIR